MKQNNKVVLFPGTVKLLTSKGREALEENRAEEALQLFLEALEISPDYYQARLGMVLAYMKLEKYNDALSETSALLKEGLGDYFDILHIHITLLVSVAKYEKVVTILEGILSEGTFPAKYAESFFDTLHFARNMTERLEQIKKIPLEEEPINEEVLQKLQSDVKEEQWQAIQMLSTLKQARVIDAFKNFLINEQNDCLLKTFVIKALKEMDVSTPVMIEKFGQQLEVIPNELQDPFEDEFVQKVMSEITERLEDHNPSLKVIALQIWSYYYFAIYPFQAEPENVNLWAAALEIVALESFGMEFDESEIASSYQVDISTLLAKVNDISMIHMEAFQNIEF